MVLKINGEKCKKIIDSLMAKLPKKNISKRIRLWFKPMKGFVIWTLIMIGLLTLTVIGFALLTTIYDTMI